MTSPELIIVGRVRKAHGVRGDLVVEPITDEPDAVFAPGRRVFAGTASGDPTKTPRELHVTTSTPFKGGYIVHFAEVADRDVADTWRDRFLLVPADELEPLGDDEVYVHELPGMRVELASGDVVGIVETVYELPQGLTLEVRVGTRDSGLGTRDSGLGTRESAGKHAKESTVLIPYDRVVTRVDREARVIEIDPPAGLLD